MIITLVNANFSGSNIGTLDTWNISRQLGAGATYSGDVSVKRGAALSATVTIADGYELGSAGVTVTMGGVTQSSAATVSGNTITISIASVTGNVVIKVPTVNTSTGEEDGGNNNDSSEVVGVAFATDTWSVIKSAIQSGNHPYKIGDTRNCNIGGTTYTLRICDLTIGRYQYADGSRSTNAVIEMVEVPVTQYALNSERANAGGYAVALMPTTITNTLIPMFPSDLQAVLEEVIIPYDTGAQSGAIDTMTAKMFVPSAYEILGSATTLSNGGTLDGHSQFQLYEQNNTADFRIKYRVGTTTSRYWNTRSTCKNTSSTDWILISSTGAEANASGANTQGTSLIFAF